MMFHVLSGYVGLLAEDQPYGRHHEDPLAVYTIAMLSAAGIPVPRCRSAQFPPKPPYPMAPGTGIVMRNRFPGAVSGPA